MRTLDFDLGFLKVQALVDEDISFKASILALKSLTFNNNSLSFKI